MGGDKGPMGGVPPSPPHLKTLDVADIKDHTPSHEAALYGHTNIIRMLLKTREGILSLCSKIPDTGSTPLH